MLDDLLEITGDIILGISERKSLRSSTKRILEVIALILGILSIVCYFLLD